MCIGKKQKERQEVRTKSQEKYEVRNTKYGFKLISKAERPVQNVEVGKTSLLCQQTYRRLRGLISCFLYLGSFFM
jgi:hypothetical protein